MITLQRARDLRSPDGQHVPGFLFQPQNVIGGVVVIHGHGGSKENTLGLSARLAEAGMVVLATDLRGHGEHPGQLDEGIIGDVEAAIPFARRYGPVAVIGKSLGGRLALMSSADVVVAISPAIPRSVSPTAQTMFSQFPSPRVREPYPGYVLDLLKRLGPPPVRDRPTLLISATHDIQSIREGTRDFAKQLPSGEYREIEEELRPPVASGHPLVDYLPYWFNHAELLENTQVLRIVPEWVRGKLISRR
jgi:pimeloyl-ACP methyl ester carboxylesterase